MNGNVFHIYMRLLFYNFLLIFVTKIITSMKQALLFTASVLILSTSCFAKIGWINNDVNINADFTVLHSAHEVVASGDLKYAESLPRNYSKLACLRKTTIPGPECFLNQTSSLVLFYAIQCLQNITSFQSKQSTV